MAAITSIEVMAAVALGRKLTVHCTPVHLFKPHYACLDKS